MPTLPIPMIFALALGWLGLRAWRQGTTPPLLLGLIALCAWQNAAIALVHHYGLTGLRPVQPVVAAAIPPLAWLAFVQAARRPLSWRDAGHALPSLVVGVSLLMAPALLDAAVPLVFAGYGAALLVALRRGGDSLHRTRLAGGDSALWLWRLIGAAMLVSALSDVAILVDFLRTGGQNMPLLIGLFSAAGLAVLGGVGLSDTLAPVSEDSPATTPAPAPPPGDLLPRADALLRDRALYRDPDLTLARLAARLHVPAKQLSAAINRGTGQNVSRYVNGFRVAHAQEMLRGGASVTDAMLDAGFQTKSNFNREFLRVTGHNPTAWRDAAQSGRAPMG